MSSQLAGVSGVSRIGDIEKMRNFAATLDVQESKSIEFQTVIGFTLSMSNLPSVCRTSPVSGSYRIFCEVRVNSGMLTSR